ncbi:MAG: HAD hydrolase-like protein [Pseudomonadota bacterium]
MGEADMGKGRTGQEGMLLKGFGGRIKAVVFDCDGVMFDTADANRIYYNRVLAYFGKPPLTEEQFVNVHMLTVKGALEYLFPEMDSLKPVYQFMGRVGYNEFIPYMIMEPGLRELLRQLKESGTIRAVATNRTNTMPAVLEEHNLKDDFDMVVTAADVENPKPSPDQLLKILDHYGLSSGELLFIGDSEYDAIAAGRAEVVFVAFRNNSLKAQFYSDSMAEIGRILGVDR